MNTSYESIYELFLNKITDYELADLVDEDLKKQLFKYLKSSIPDFKYCVKDLSDRDDTLGQFNMSLTDNEQDILCKYMLVHWLEPHILRLENIRQIIGSKDFKTYSPAEMLSKLTNLKIQLMTEAEADMIFYYYAT